MAKQTPHWNQMSRPRSPALALRQLWQLPTFFLGLLAMLGVWLGRPLWQDLNASPHSGDLRAYRHYLEEAPHDLQAAVARGQELLAQVEPVQRGELHFLLGTALLRLTDKTAPETAAPLWREARTHLEQAYHVGVPSSDRPRLHYRLAKSWLKTGGDKVRSVEFITQALAFGADDRVEALGLLTQAHLLPPADVNAALEANGKLLAQPTLDEGILAPARLLRGQLLTDQRQFAAAADVLQSMSGTGPPGILASARELLVRCYLETEAWAKAAELLERILNDQAMPPREPGRAAYELGLCYQRLSERHAEARGAWQRAAETDGPHGRAAAFRLAEMAVLEQQSEESLVRLSQVLARIAQPEEFVNPLVTAAEVAALLERAAIQARESGAHATAQQLAGLLDRIAPAGRAAAVQGEVAAAGARAEQGTNPARAREQFVAAGQAYERASQASGGTLEHQLLAAENYRLAERRTEQTRMLEELLQRKNLSQEHQAEAWFRLGEARRTLGQSESARAAFAEAVQRGGVFEDQARFQLADLELAAGRLETAMLQLTLNANLLGKKSEDARDRSIYVKTLVALGDLLVRQGQPQAYRDALSKYSLALTSLGDTPAAWPVRFKVGACYWEIARELRVTGHRNPKVQETWEENRRKNLKWAQESFGKLEEAMTDFERNGGAFTAEQLRLRIELRFHLAGTHFEREEFALALPQYRELAHQTAGTLEGLIALEGVARCYAFLNQPQEVADTLQQIQAALPRVPDLAFTGQGPRATRRYWQTELSNQLLQATTKQP